MTQLTETTILGIVVPGDARNINMFNPWIVKFYDKDGFTHAIDLPPGEWSIVGTASWKDGKLECDFDAADIVDSKFIKEYNKIFFRNYLITDGTYYGLIYATESLASLLQSKGIELKPKQKVLILKTKAK